MIPFDDACYTFYERGDQERTRLAGHVTSGLGKHNYILSQFILHASLNFKLFGFVLFVLLCKLHQMKIKVPCGIHAHLDFKGTKLL